MYQARVQERAVLVSLLYFRAMLCILCSAGVMRGGHLDGILLIALPQTEQLHWVFQMFLGPYHPFRSQVKLCGQRVFNSKL